MDVITVQEASYSTSAHEAFTINLGVAVPEFRKVIWPDKDKKILSEAECVVRVRLGDLMQGKLHGGALDQWWEIDGVAGSAETIGQEIENALKVLGIPFLERFDKFSAIVGHMHKTKGWQTKNPLMVLYRALAEWKAGASNEALESLSNVKGKAWKAKVDVVRKLIKGS